MFKTEYRHDGKTYRLVVLNAESSRKLALVEQRSKAHQLKGHLSGIYEEIPRTWAILLGISVEEAAELPLRLLTQMTKDVESAMEVVRRDFSSLGPSSRGRRGPRG